MGWFNRKKNEERAAQGEVQVERDLLRAFLCNDIIDKRTALQVPTVSGAIDLISNIIAGTPIKLYKENDGKAEEVQGDRRVKLLNDETGDTLNANEFWKAIIRDYYLGKGGYAYINRERGRFKSLHYVDEEAISINKNADPIFKDFNILVNGNTYYPFEFIKILRNTKDGAEGIPITRDSSELINVAFQSLKFEAYIVKKGGNKKGFLLSERRLDDLSVQKLKEGFAKLYSNLCEHVVVLNNGVKFQESSNTSVEMQLNENKKSNAEEFAKIFHISTDIMGGKVDSSTSLAKLAAIPLMNTIQCALNKDFLLEREKGTYYWAFDTKELLKGDMAERFGAYKTALDANFMQIDEVRFAEDMEPLGLNWIKLGLQDVLYNPDTKEIYTPNTNQIQKMDTLSLHYGDKDDIIDSEVRARQWTKGEKGYFTGSIGTGGGSGGTGSKSGKTKYSPSPQRNRGGIQLSPKKYAKLCGTLGTQYPGLEAGEVRQIRDAKHEYTVQADGYGGFKTIKIKKLN